LFIFFCSFGFSFPNDCKVIESRSLFITMQSQMYISLSWRYSGQWSGIFSKLARYGYTLRVTSQASYYLLFNLL
jgi:hypothetical protein